MQPMAMLVHRLRVTCCSGMARTWKNHAFGHYDALLAPLAGTHEVFYLPATVAAAPRTEVAILLQDVLSVKREGTSALVQAIKRQRACKAEMVKQEKVTSQMPISIATGPMQVDSDSEQEQDTGGVKKERCVPAAAPPRIPPEMLFVPDSDGEDVPDTALVAGMTPPEMPVPLTPPGEQGAMQDASTGDDVAMEVEHEQGSEGERLPLLKVQEKWLELLLSGRKVWELRTTNCHHRGRIALGYNFLVHGFVDIVDVKVVGLKTGSSYTAPPVPENYWLAPANLDKHQATADIVKSMNWKGTTLFAYVMANPVRLPVKVAYAHEHGPVQWSSVPANIFHGVLWTSRSPAPALQANRRTNKVQPLPAAAATNYRCWPCPPSTAH